MTLDSFGAGECRVKISYDPHKRRQTLEERSLDFDDAVQVFAGPTAEALDDRKDYGEPRYQSFGMLGGRLVTLVWTPRGDTRHIISMREANEREQQEFGRQLGS